MLVVDDAQRHFGGVAALGGVSLSVGPGEVVGLIGPNGSGKSTLVNAISGFVRLDGGSVSVGARSISGLGAAAVRRAGVSRTFQNLRLFEPMTALENLRAGMHLLFTRGRGLSLRWIPAAFGAPSARAATREVDELASAALASVDLSHRADTVVGDLSYGEKKRLEIARALLLQPAFTLLDEPTAGLSPDEASELIALVSRAREGAARPGVLLVEHRLELVLEVCDRVVVLDNGKKIAEGTPEEIESNALVQEVYVGT